MKITTYMGEKPIMRIHFGDPGLRTAAPPMVISQAAVEGALRSRLGELGGEIEWANPIVDLHQDGEGVVATLGTEEEADAGWLVGYDWAGSTTRRLVGIQWPSRDEIQSMPAHEIVHRNLAAAARTAADPRFRQVGLLS